MNRLPSVCEKLLTDTESCDNGTISLDVNLLEVAEKASSLTDHHQKAASAVVILLVNLEVLGEVVDPSGEQGDLNLGRTGVAFVGGVFRHDSLLFFFQHVCFHLSKLFAYVSVKGCETSALRLVPQTEA